MFTFLDNKSFSIIKQKILFQLTLIIFFILTGCHSQQEYLISGRTMGTTYHIKYNAGFFFKHQPLKKAIEEQLSKINSSMSTFDPKSEISVFNKMRDTTKVISISDDFYQVLIQARRLYQLTEGAWDGTVKPLVNLWGFGNTSHPQQKPDQQTIKRVLNNVGFNNIVIDNHIIQKKNPDIQLNLASIAKGFGVDLVAQVLDNHTIENYLVEIGGEVYARGQKINGKPWRVGINRPKVQSALNDVYYAIAIKDKAIATSGDYRNYFMDGTKRYSHVIDPKTGQAVQNKIVSASVISDTCTFADGLATALMVMGVEKGLSLVNQLSDTECFLIQENKSGDGFDHFYSDHFPIKGHVRSQEKQ
ncbi:ApbE-like lipoprotein [Candidatus Magnetomorum sp. HK-1]|nr:ApbE-like lipoprotein [Candidatus Magnetomorum sp. HK-1]